MSRQLLLSYPCGIGTLPPTGPLPVMRKALAYLEEGSSHIGTPFELSHILLTLVKLRLELLTPLPEPLRVLLVVTGGQKIVEILLKRPL